MPGVGSKGTVPFFETASKFEFRRFRGGPPVARPEIFVPADRRKNTVLVGNCRVAAGLPGAAEKLGKLRYPGFQL